MMNICRRVIAAIQRMILSLHRSIRTTLAVAVVTALFASAAARGEDAPPTIDRRIAESNASEVVASPTDAGQNESAIATRNVLTVIRDGGPMLFPIIGCSVLLFMFVFERAISLRRRRIIPRHFVKRFLHQLQEEQLKPEEALDLCEENRSPIAEVFAAGVKKWNRPSVEVEQAVLDTGERVANDLRRYLRLFNGIATVSPLLGLLGTVLGMISAFNDIATADAMGRPEQLAEGISQALLTTAGGLSVAIPAFIVYLFFTSKVDRLVIEIDALGQELVQSIASDAWKGSVKRKVKGTRKAA